MALYGCRYIQSDDPGAVGAGLEWVDPVGGAFKIRNETNTGWIEVGDIDSDYLGKLPATGGAVTQPFLGAHGLATLGMPALRGAPKIDGYDIADQAWVNSLLNDLKNVIGTKVNKQLGVIAERSSVGFNLAKKIGYVKVNAGATVTLPKPQFPNGDYAEYADCHWYAWPAANMFPDDTTEAAFKDVNNIWDLSRQWALYGFHVEFVTDNPPVVKAHNAAAGTLWIGYFIFSLRGV